MDGPRAHCDAYDVYRRFPQDDQDKVNFWLSLESFPCGFVHLHLRIHRFGETLPQVDNMLIIQPFETSQRHLRTVTDWSTYKKLHSTLPAVALAAFKARVRSGDPKAIRELWAKKDKAFLAIDFEWSERNDNSCLEWGYAAVRCGHLDT
jgi:hypothetical protein